MALVRNIFFSFPFQLVLLHLRKYLFMLLPWLLLILIVTGNFGAKFGLQFLFLDPEYLGRVNALSFFLVGTGVGGFIFIWNITSYILNSFRFPFLATFGRPFIRYSLNNGFFPLLFVIIYFVALIKFQYYSELESFGQIIVYQLSLLAGMSLSLIITLAGSLNIHAEKISGTDNGRIKKRWRRLNIMPRSQTGIFSKEIRVEYVLIHPLRVRHVREVHHYPAETLMKVFRLHHKNALMIELLALVMLIMLGFNMEKRFFQLPAATSLMLLLGIFLAPIGALSFWLRTWAVTAFLGIFVLANLLVKLDFIYHKSSAFGLDYKGTPVTYDLKTIEATANTFQYEQDRKAGLAMLENWKQKVTGYYDNLQKPPLVIVNASGGGLKASLWSFRLMQIADSATADRFFDHVAFISGASGGMIGEAFYRELYLRKKLGDPVDLQNSVYADQISTDILNAIALTYVVNDVLFPWQRYRFGFYKYRKDRGYMFELRLNENTGYVMDKRISDYAAFEQQAKIPMMLFNSTIIADGRNLMISSSPVSYLGVPPGYLQPGALLKVDGLDIKTFLRDKNANGMKFTSAIRMNSTFPYVLPTVHLPTSPSVQCMDGGMRDNYGLESAMRFVYVYKDWINENCSRIIFVQSRGDYEKNYQPIIQEHPSLVKRMLEPISSLYSNWSDYQDYHQDQLLSMAESWMTIPMDVLPFEYVPEKKDQVASMSLHLTTREKQNVKATLYNGTNRAQLTKLVTLLSQ